MPRPDETITPTVESREKDSFYGDILTAAGAIAVGVAGIAVSLVGSGVKRAFKGVQEAHASSISDDGETAQPPINSGADVYDPKKDTSMPLDFAAPHVSVVADVTPPTLPKPYRPGARR